MEAYDIFNAERGNIDETCEADHELELKFDDSWVAWCPSRDIIGVVSRSSHLIEVFRIEERMEKVFSAQVNYQPTAFEFERQGHYFAIGNTQGRISILKSDTLDEVKCFLLEESTSD